MTEASLSSLLTRWIKTRQVNRHKFEITFNQYAGGEFGIDVTHPSLSKIAFFYWDGRSIHGAWYMESASLSVQPEDPSFFQKLGEWLRKQIREHGINGQED